MSGYTPTTEEVRWQYTREEPPRVGTVSEKTAEFDNWLEVERCRVRSEVARDIEVTASQYILNSDFRAGMLHAACIVRNEWNGS